MVKTMIDVVEERIRDEIASAQESNGRYLSLQIPLRISADSGIAVVDIETTGLNPNSSEIVTLGIMHYGQLQIIQNLTMTPEDFRDILKDFLDDVEEHLLVRDFYAFNCSFERRFLGDKYDWKEIQPYRISKDRCIVFDHFGFGGRSAFYRFGLRNYR